MFWFSENEKKFSKVLGILSIHLIEKQHSNMSSNEPFENIYAIFSQFSIVKFEIPCISQRLCHVNIHLSDGTALNYENVEVGEINQHRSLDCATSCFLDCDTPDCDENDMKSVTERLAECELECGKPVLMPDFVTYLASLFVSYDIQSLWMLSEEPGVHQFWFDHFKSKEFKYIFYLETDRRQLNASSFFVLSSHLLANCDKTKKVFRGQVICRFQKHEKRADFDFLQKLVHQNIERVNEICENEYFVFVQTDEYKETLSNVLPETSKRQIFLDVLSGLEFLNRNNVCHGSIKETNIACNGVCWIVTDLVGNPRNEPWKKKNEFRSPYETPNDPKNDLWTLIWIIMKTYFNLDKREFEEMGKFKYPFNGEADARLNGTPIGQTLKMLLLGKLCDNDYGTVRQILETISEKDHFDEKEFYLEQEWFSEVIDMDVQKIEEQLIHLEIEK